MLPEEMIILVVIYNYITNWTIQNAN